MQSNKLLFKSLCERAGLTVDWKLYEKVMGEYIPETERARVLRRSSADWSYIESRPEPLKTALKVLVETGDLKLVSTAFSIPLDLLNDERRRARIPMVLLYLPSEAKRTNRTLWPP